MKQLTAEKGTSRYRRMKLQMITAGLYSAEKRGEEQCVMMHCGVR
jgi:hypothetical protein